MKTSVLCLSMVMLAMGCSQNVQNMSILEGVRSHDCVVRARVVEVGGSPGFRSGFLTAVQEVTYEVLDVYKGQETINGKQVCVSHVLVGGGFAEDTTPRPRYPRGELVGSEHVMDDTPRLSPRLFVPGAEVVLFIRKSYPGLFDGLYVVGDDPVGVFFVRDGHLSHVGLN